MIERGHQFQQLAMLMTPQELSGAWSGDYFPHKVDEAVKDINENQPTDQRRLWEDVREDGGLHTPVMLAYSHPEGHLLVNGHHRVALATQHNLLVPVQHYANPQDAYDEVRHEDAYYPRSK